MVKVPIARTRWQRQYAGSVVMPVVNRFFETDPTSTADDTALLARPGTTNYRAFGTGPNRGLFTQVGVFGDDLFIASGTALIRWDGTNVTTITGTLANSPDPVSITYQKTPGVERLWIADGTNLYFYEGLSKAVGSLTFTVQPTATDVVEIGGVYYEFVAANVNTGSPAGTVTNPWLVLIGTELAGSITNLGAAIDNSGLPGGQYSSAVTAHPTVETRRVEPTRLIVQARTAGTGGNSITTTETGAGMSWGAGTLLDGGIHALVAVPVPTGGTEAAISVTTLAGYIIIAVAGSQRMYVVRPAEFWVEDFFEAESEPDLIYQVITIGDSFWALGATTIEPFSATGDLDFPFAPIAGRALRYGIIPGTAIVLDDRVIFVDDRGIVRDSSGQRLSTHDIEEQIRLRG
jgi:hypothetical protein